MKKKIPNEQALIYKGEKNPELFLLLVFFFLLARYTENEWCLSVPQHYITTVPRALLF